MTSVVAQKLKMRDDVVTDGGRAADVLSNAPHVGGRLLCRSESGRVMALHSDPTQFTLAEARDALLAKRISARELAEAHSRAVSQARRLNAFITETFDRASQQAAESDRRMQQGEARALEGHSARDQGPVLYREYPHHRGEPHSGEFHSALRIHGYAAISGMRAPCLSARPISTNSRWARRTKHPRSVRSSIRGARVGAMTISCPDGSSGGSAVAVAARLASAAIGTDTGGSIRQPAAVTGIVGLKPTYGRCSRWGIVAFASSLDQAGPMTRTVRDAAIMLRAMASVDPLDSTSVDEPVPDYEAELDNGVKGLRIGIPQEYRVEGAAPEIDALWSRGAEWLKSEGAELREVSLPHTKYALPAYYIVAPAEASSNLARYDGMRYRPPRGGCRRPDRNLRKNPRRRFRSGSEASDHDRHLCALGRLLRCLLSAGAEGAEPDCA